MRSSSTPAATEGISLDNFEHLFLVYNENVKLNNTPDQLLAANSYFKATIVVDADFRKN